MIFGTDHIAIGPELFVVVVRGDLDLNTSDQLKARLRYVIGEGAKFVCIDLLEVGYMDSTGLTPMVGAYNQITQLKGRLTVACPPHLCEVLQVTGLADLFGVHASRDDAVAFLSALAAE